jgi:hypothetical protein
MNKIVREHYPVANLPEDLREEFEGLDTVTVQIQTDSYAQADHDFWSLSLDEVKPRTRDEVIADFERIRSLGLPNVTPDEAVARIRELRDEWDD